MVSGRHLIRRRNHDPEIYIHIYHYRITYNSNSDVIHLLFWEIISGSCYIINSSIHSIYYNKFSHIIYYNESTITIFPPLEFAVI